MLGTTQLVVDHDLDVVKTSAAEVGRIPPLMILEMGRGRDELELGAVEVRTARADRKDPDAGAVRLHCLADRLR